MGMRDDLAGHLIEILHVSGTSISWDSQKESYEIFSMRASPKLAGEERVPGVVLISWAKP